MWIKPSYATGDNTRHYIYSSAAAANNNNRIQLRKMDNNNYEVLIFDSAGSQQTTLTFADTLIPQNTWAYIVFSWETNSAKLYLNGVQKDIDTSVTVPTGINPILAIGSWIDGTTYGYSGQIDDVKVFNYALTAQQVKNEYNQEAVNFGPVTGTP